MGLFDRLIGGIPTSTAIASGDLPGTIASNTTGTAANITGTSNATLTTLSALTTASALSSIGTITTGVWNGTTIAIANGGTGQTSAASAFNALNPMTTTGDLIYESATGVASRLGIGSTNQVLTVVGGVPTWASGGSGTVTSVALTVPTFLSVSGSPITTSGTLAVSLSGTALPVANGGTGLTTGTSGGILGYTATGTLASSALLTLHGIILGGGAGATPTALAVGATGTILTGVAASAPAFSATPTLGVNTTVAGTLTLAPGIASGASVTIKNLATTTTAWNFNLPTSAGSAGQVLTSQGGGATSMTWTNAGAGTVTSVALSDGSTTPIYTISGSPVTTSGTLTFTLATQSANTVFAGPNGSSGQPGFRSLVAGDMPAFTGGDVTTAAGSVVTSIVATSNSTLATLSALASVGTITTGVWNGTAITPAFGGTGLTTLTAYAILAGGTTSTGTLQQVSGVGSSGQVLTSNGASALPTWQAAPGLPTIVSVSSTTTASAGQFITTTGSSTIIVNLQTAVGVAGQTITVNNLTTNFTTVQLRPQSGQSIGTIGVGNFFDLHTNGELITLISDGSNWQLLNHFTNSPRLQYTPTFVGFGTVTTSNIFWQRDGTDVIISGSFVAGTVSATTNSISLPGSIQATGSGSSASLEICGDAVRSSGASTTFFRNAIMVNQSASTIGLGAQTSTALAYTIGNGSTVAATGDTIVIKARITISDWQP